MTRSKVHSNSVGRAYSRINVHSIRTIHFLHRLEHHDRTTYKAKALGREIHRQDRPLVRLSKNIFRKADISAHRMHEFNQSLRYDQRMHAADIKGSIAYAKALRLVHIITPEEEHKLIQGLTSVGKEWEEGIVRRLHLLYHQTTENASCLSVCHPAGR